MIYNLFHEEKLPLIISKRHFIECYITNQALKPPSISPIIAYDNHFIPQNSLFYLFLSYCPSLFQTFFFHWSQKFFISHMMLLVNQTKIIVCHSLFWSFFTRWIDWIMWPPAMSCDLKSHTPSFIYILSVSFSAESGKTSSFPSLCVFQ